MLRLCRLSSTRPLVREALVAQQATYTSRFWIIATHFFDVSMFVMRAVSYNDLLTVFWDRLNPTTLNQQGNDIGTQYRSA